MSEAAGCSTLSSVFASRLARLVHIPYLRTLSPRRPPHPRSSKPCPPHFRPLSPPALQRQPPVLPLRLRPPPRSRAFPPRLLPRRRKNVPTPQRCHLHSVLAPQGCHRRLFKSRRRVPAIPCRPAGPILQRQTDNAVAPPAHLLSLNTPPSPTSASAPTSPLPPLAAVAAPITCWCHKKVVNTGCQSGEDDVAKSLKTPAEYLR